MRVLKRIKSIEQLKVGTQYRIGLSSTIYVTAAFVKIKGEVEGEEILEFKRLSTSAFGNEGDLIHIPFNYSITIKEWVEQEQ